MSNLTAGFSTRMRKRASSAQGETTLSSKVYGGKHPKRSSLDEEAQRSLASLEGAAQYASREACASLEDGALAKGPPNTDQTVSEALAVEITIGPSPWDKRSNLTFPGAYRARLPDKLMLGSYVKPIEWGRLSVDTPTLSPEEA